ncbi:TPA: hypothetical protein QC116_003138 [Bacillus thuringiensis]|nr:hypothetical protein [Bacillus thuringiensis]
MDLLSFMKKAIKDVDGKETALCDGFQFTIEQWEECKKKRKTAKNGVIYGFAINLNESKKLELLSEVKRRKTKNKDLIKIEEIFDSYYILYWGKSIDADGRGQAHVKGHKNWNLHLDGYECLKNYPIEYAFVYVENYEDIERKLISKYPPLLRTVKAL